MRRVILQVGLDDAACDLLVVGGICRTARVLFLSCYTVSIREISC